MTTQGPNANFPPSPQQGGTMSTGQSSWAPQNGQQPNGAPQQFTEAPPKRREMNAGTAWALTLLIPLVVVLGGYALLHLFFGRVMPTPVDAGRYVLEMADGDTVTCTFDATTPGGSLDCESEDIPDANLSGSLSAAAQTLAQSIGLPSDGVPVLGTLTNGTVYDIETSDGTMTIDMSADNRILISGDGRDLEITPDGVTVTEADEADAS